MNMIEESMVRIMMMMVDDRDCSLQKIPNIY